MMNGNDMWPRRVPLPCGRVTSVGRSRENDVVLAHPSVSGQHCRVEPDAAGWLLVDAGAKFGTTVNGTRVVRVALKNGDVVRFASGPDYRFDDQALQLLDAGVGDGIELAGVGVIRDGLVLLKGIDCRLRAGSFVGVLGPSGAGKSLLVGCLSSTIAPDQGEIRFGDGKTVREHEDEYRARLGVVTQEDLVQLTLTVEESIELAGRLRLPEVAPEERRQRLAAVLEEVDLAQHRAKQVGVLSGGQRKRVSVAIELLMRPQVLLLDEPTSGLDPGVAARLMDVLRGLARRGLTVVCTTHTLDTMNYFDDVFVLGLEPRTNGKGKCGTLAYFGAPSELLPRFGVRNLVDLFERLQDLRQGVSSTVVRASDSDSDSGDGASGRARRGLRAPERRRADPRLLEQLPVVVRRSNLGFWRDPGSAALNLSQPFLLALLTILAQHEAPNSAPIHFFLVVAALWMGMTLTVREVVRERKLYVRDRLVALTPGAYIIGKVVWAAATLTLVALCLQVAASIFAPLILVEPEGAAAAARAALGLGSTADQLARVPFLGSWLVLWLTSVAGALVGLVLSTRSPSERVAVMLLPIALLLQVLLSRVVFGHATLPWDDPSSPYGPVGDFSAYLESSASTWQGSLTGLLSLATVSRPATAVLEYWVREESTTAAATSEWLYFATVCGLYMLVAYGAFRVTERRWIHELR